MPPLALTAANSTVSVKAGDLASSALLTLNAISQGDVANADDSSWALECLQRRIDLVNAQKQLIYNENFTVFNFLANHSPNTIGPAGDFNVPTPPVEIVSASLLLPSGSTHTDLPLRLLTDSEWAANAIKDLTSTIPTALFYSRDFPLGNIILWPLATKAGSVRLQMWSNIAQALALGTSLAMPPAYWSFLMCALAADMAPSYGTRAMQVVESGSFMQQYREARNAIQSNNSEVPPLKSDVPSSRRGSAIPDFNFLTGQRG